MVSKTIETEGVKISALLDNMQPMELNFFFPDIPEESWVHYQDLYPEVFMGPRQVDFKFNCYLLRTDERNILVDTGIGSASSPFCVHNETEGHLLDTLLSEGLEPDDIDTVIFTHLHPDHVGWNTYVDKGIWRPTFQRANFIARREDWDTLGKKDVQALFEHPFFDECIQPLKATNRLELISEDINITEVIRLIHHPGHTPGSMCVLIGSDDTPAMLCGDIFTTPAQFYKPDWAYTFDMDKQEARSTRRNLVQLATDQPIIIAAAHFSGFWRRVSVDGVDEKCVWKPL